ncbi:MAG: tetratricopeptide repeat protein [Planctomycetes bacterium]|nr:tetratricopeptide repeat protein [Planctomycetota bacterium]
MVTQAQHTSTLPVLPERELRLLLDGLTQWVAGLSQGAGKTARLGLLEGEEHRGSSLLLSSLKDLFHPTGLRWLGGAFGVRTCVPGGAFTEALEQIAGFARDPEAKERQFVPSLLETHGASLRALLPRAAEAEAALDLPALGAEGDRLRLIDAVVAFLLDYARQVPTVLILEELGRADSLGRDIFLHMSRMLSRSRASRDARLLVIASHSVPQCKAGGEACVSPFADVDADAPIAFRIQARGYSRDDIETLAQRAGRDLPLSSREALYRISRGNVPLLSWFFRAPLSSSIVELNEGALDLGTLVAERYRELPGAQRLAALSLATLRYRLPLSRWAACVPRFRDLLDVPSEWGGEECLEALVEELEAGGWGRAGDFHPEPEQRLFEMEKAVADAVLEAEARDVVDRARERWIDVFLGGAAENPRDAFALAAQVLDLEPPEVARILARGDPLSGPSDEGADRGVDPMAAGLRAAQQLCDAGCQEEALELLECLARGGSGSAAGGAEQLGERIADLLEETGNHREAIDARRRSLERLSGAPAVERARVLRILGRLDRKLEDPRRASERLRQAEDLLAGQPPSEELARLLLEAAQTWNDMGRTDDAWRSGRQALEILDALENPPADLRRSVLGWLLDATAQSGWSSEREQMARSLLAACEEQGDLAGSVAALEGLARSLMARGESTLSESTLKEALRLASRTGGRWLKARVLAAMGEHCGQRQRPVEARRLLAEAAEIFHCFDQIAEVQRIGTHLLQLDLEMGHFCRSAATARGLLEREYELPQGSLSTFPEEPVVEAFLAERLREEAGAAAERRRRLEKQALKGWDRLEPAEALELAGLWLRAGRVLPTMRLLETMFDCDEFRERAVEAAEALRLRGRLAYLCGDLDVALESYELCLERLAATPDRRTLAKAHTDVGVLLAERGRLARALDHLVRGLTVRLAEGDPADVAEGLNAMTEFLADSGQSDAARQLAITTAALAHRFADARGELRACRLLGRASASAEAHLAEKTFEHALRLQSHVEDALEKCLLHLDRGWDRLRRGDHAGSLQEARAGIELARSMDLRLLLDDLLHLVGVIESSRENPRKNFLRALEALEQARAGAERMGRPRLACRVLRAMGGLYAARGKQELAEEFFERAEAVQSSALRDLPRALREVRWEPEPRGDV